MSSDIYMLIFLAFGIFTIISLFSSRYLIAVISCLIAAMGFIFGMKEIKKEENKEKIETVEFFIEDNFKILENRGVLSKLNRDFLKENNTSVNYVDNDKILVIEFKNLSNKDCEKKGWYFSRKSKDINELIVNNFLFKPIDINGDIEIDINKAPLSSNINKVCEMGELNKVKIVKYLN